MTAETVIERALTRGVIKLRGICWKWPPSARAGVPDRIVIVDGRVFFIELKRPGGKLRPIQVSAHALLRRAGADVRVLDSLGAVEDFLSEVGKNQGEPEK